MHCTPREGEVCRREGEGRCRDAAHAWVCQGGTWSTQPCRGVGGCRTEANALQCDQSAAREDEGCSQIGQRACSEPGVAKPGVLVCLQATRSWAREGACLGPGGCRAAEHRIECDDTLSAIGELCLQEGQRACSQERGSLLRCTDGRFALERPCAGCRADGDAGVSCE